MDAVFLQCHCLQG